MASISSPFPPLTGYPRRRRRRVLLCSGSSPAKEAATAPLTLPVRKIPGGGGFPLVGPFRDRLDFFYNQGPDDFFRSRIRQHRSTVFRANLPPGPLVARDAPVVVLLDGKSFPVLFDATRVDKTDLFTGTFMPPPEFTGGYRALPYLDPSELSHARLKKLMFAILKSRRDHIIPEFRSAYSDLFDALEIDISSRGTADFGSANEQTAFDFLSMALFGVRPGETELGLEGPRLVRRWVLALLGPILTLSLVRFIEYAMIQTLHLPPFYVREDYSRLYNYFQSASGNLLDEAEAIGISRDEACHNLLFITCFNAFGGMKILFPSMLKWISRGGVILHTRLAREIRSAVRSNGGEITLCVMERMSLMKSAVFECLRIEPPLPLQYGRAKTDLIIESHDSAFQVKAGELMFGYQTFATKDPRIFDRPEEYLADRFVGDEGERLLRHVLWSNGPENANPNLGNKQCAGKDFVVMVARLLLVELFLRYDSFDIEVRSSPLGPSVTLTSLKRATF